MQEKSIGRLAITGNLWTRFADGLLKRLSRMFGANRPKNKNEVVEKSFRAFLVRIFFRISHIFLNYVEETSW